jgi:hypothetical protein
MTRLYELIIGDRIHNFMSLGTSNSPDYEFT